MTTPQFDALDDRHLDHIDAAVFSSDMFNDLENRRALRLYLDRWERQMKLNELPDQGTS